MKLLYEIIISVVIPFKLLIPDINDVLSIGEFTELLSLKNRRLVSTVTAVQMIVLSAFFLSYLNKNNVNQDINII